MLIFLAACLGAFLPALFFAAVIYALDRYEQEPWYLVLSAFVWGAVVAVIFALISQLLVMLVLAAVTGGEESLGLEIFQASGAGCGMWSAGSSLNPAPRTLHPAPSAARRPPPRTLHPAPRTPSPRLQLIS